GRRRALDDLADEGLSRRPRGRDEEGKTADGRLSRREHRARRARALRRICACAPADRGSRRRRGAQCRRAGGDHEIIRGEIVGAGRMIRFLVLAAGLLVATASLAQWPSKPIHAVVPSPPGGPPDLILRMLNGDLAAILGQAVLVENRAGAGGVVGT